MNLSLYQTSNEESPLSWSSVRKNTIKRNQQSFFKTKVGDKGVVKTILDWQKKNVDLPIGAHQRPGLIGIVRPAAGRPGFMGEAQDQVKEIVTETKGFLSKAILGLVIIFVAFQAQKHLF